MNLEKETYTSIEWTLNQIEHVYEQNILDE